MYILFITEHLEFTITSHWEAYKVGWRNTGYPKYWCKYHNNKSNFFIWRGETWKEVSMETYYSLSPKRLNSLKENL